MRIILIGSHGTGKTTLCKAVKEACANNIAIRDGVSRPIKVCKNKLGLSPYQEQAIINELTFFYWDYNKDFDLLLSTRSPIDCAVYSRVFGWDDLADECEYRLQESNILNDKDVVWVYIPIEFELKDDGVRFTDVDLQKDIDGEMRNIILKHGIDCKVVRGSIKERVQMILDIISDYNTSKK